MQRMGTIPPDHAGRQTTIDPLMSPAAVPAVPRRRNVAVLTLAQALFMSVQGMAIATTPLAGYMLLGADEKWLATVPIFLAHLGIMGTTIPASLLMGAIGRRAGFSLGALLGVAFGAVGCLAIYRQSFPLLCLAALLQGMQAAILLVFPPRRGRRDRARLSRQGHIAGHGRRRGRRLHRAAGRQVGGRLAGARDVRGRLRGHGRLLDRRAAARAAPARSRG